ncbi:Diaminohydroxyphosphoribosylamino-pyrimidine deaminase [Lasiodiplodia hormozganensis]|uniref:Diaminohydroxyphosphoribosylamino-pyrimidine deaminase n=1 Tax=Lasiodiplodia hormozganensis TaxID=869390 RepID=A0AA39Z4B1_9PEZI|nr:Diaminohydroxyphosphoribosylamino-pyrimidine deaminase [Lasiodiplodia hormozganensis]
MDAVDALQRALHDEVADPEEDAFLVFSQPVPSHELGILDPKAASLDVTVAGRDLTIAQSPGLLTSNRALGSTGAVVWKVTPLFAEWLASEDNVLFRSHALTPHSTVLELGCGVAGIVPLALAPRIGRYVATDQDYVLKLLKQNVAQNTSLPSSRRAKPQKPRANPGGASAGNIETLTLDWERDSVAALPQQLNQQSDASDDVGVDAVIACDCIYNEALIEPFNSTCAEICALRAKGSRPTFCIIAQQRRTYEVFEQWLISFHKRFRVWKLSDEHLPEGLKEGSGFMVHIGVLRQ